MKTVGKGLLHFRMNTRLESDILRFNLTRYDSVIYYCVVLCNECDVFGRCVGFGRKK